MRNFSKLFENFSLCNQNIEKLKIYTLYHKNYIKLLKII